jgi:nitrous oxidase accessory protein NosD
MNGKGKLFALAVTVILLSTLVSLESTVKASTPRTIIVPDDFTTIKGAINNASDGDTVLVRAGTYNGSLGISKSISLIGENAQNTIITSQHNFRYGKYSSAILVEDRANTVTISGFTIKTNDAGIYIYETAGSATITNNIITCSSGDYSIGIEGAGSGYTTISSNTINGVGQEGISIQNPSETDVHNNFVSGYHLGISISKVTVRIHDNTITHNDRGVYLQGNPLTFNNNNIFDNNQYSVYPSFVPDIDATYNWWGTTDPDAINQTIAHYNAVNYPLVNVNFIPFLTEYNPQAMPNPSSPVLIPTRTPSPTPSVSPAPSIIPTSSPTNAVPEFPSWAISLLLSLMVVVAGLLVYHKKYKNSF